MGITDGKVNFRVSRLRDSTLSSETELPGNRATFLLGLADPFEFSSSTFADYLQVARSPSMLGPFIRCSTGNCTHGSFVRKISSYEWREIKEPQNAREMGRAKTIRIKIQMSIVEGNKRRV